MIGPAPALPRYASGASPHGGMNVPDNWGEELNASLRTLNDRESEIEAILARSDASADVQSQLCPTVEIKSIVA